jgi:hypothetical protein
MKRINAILKQAAPIMRRAALLNEAGAVRPKLRGRALLKMVGAAPRIPVPYYNKKGRQFFLTLKGVYVVRVNGKSLYGLKAYRNAQGVIKNSSLVPAKIRPARVKK